jgi:phospholipid transport system substrate-binding protein
MEPISRFVLGRYARVASDSQMSTFRDVFLQVVTQRFLPLFEGYTTDDFHVDGAKPDPRSDGLYLVNSRVRSPKNDQFAKAGWRVRHKNGDYEIVDVIAEGVSMAITLRSEYSSVIQQNGGRVEALIAKLKEKVKAGEVQSTAMSETEG